MGVGSRSKPTYVSGRVLKIVEKLGKTLGLDDEGRLGKLTPTHGYRKNEPIIQHVHSQNPSATAQKVWDEFKSEADSVGPLQKVKGGFVAKFGLSTFVTYRPTSSLDGSPAVSINDQSSTGFLYKIHFIKQKVD
jgi:hypothetical protein